MITRAFRLFQACPLVSGTLLFLLLFFFLAACAVRPIELARPNGVAVAPDGSLYVMDRGNYRVVHLSPEGKFLASFGQLGAGPGDIYSAWDIALDSAGNVYFCNQVFNQAGSHVIHDGVKVFSPDGRFLRELGDQDYPPDNTITRRTPYGLHIDSQDRVYVADFDTNTVRVFDPQGRQLATLFGEPGNKDGQFNGLIDVAVDEKQGLLTVVDQFNSRVQQFELDLSPAGNIAVTHRRTVGGYGRQPGQFSYPQGAAVDEENRRLYISDVANRRIQVLNDDGQPASALTVPGDWQVLGLAIGPDQTLYAADALNNTIWFFEPDGRLAGQVEVQR
jgi:DNA-binding beta-propeller fold protein YncE